MDELDKFTKHLNLSNDSIKFTSEIYDKDLNILDVKVRLVDNQLTNDLYNRTSRGVPEVTLNGRLPRAGLPECGSSPH